MRQQRSAAPQANPQLPAPIPDQLIAHLPRWHRLGIANDYFVEWNGRPVQSVKKAFRTAVRLAGLEGKVTPHTLRHTAATWSVNKRAPLWQAAGLVGMSEDMREAAEAIQNNRGRLGRRPPAKALLPPAAQ